MDCNMLNGVDTLVLLSILYASNFGESEVGVGQIISAFDVINHEIISYEELENAFCKLTQYHYIKEEGILKFLPTKKITKLFLDYRNNHKKSRFIEEDKYIEQIFKQQDNKIIVTDGCLKYPNFNRDIYQAACKVYLGK